MHEQHGHSGRAPARTRLGLIDWSFVSVRAAMHTHTYTCIQTRQTLGHLHALLKPLKKMDRWIDSTKKKD